MIMASCFEVVMSLSALRCAWNVTVVITYMWTAEKISFCTTACMLHGLQSQSIDNIVSCSQTLTGRRGSLRDSGYV